MADTRFFKKKSNFSVRDIAEHSGCIISNDNKADVLVEDVAPLNTAKLNDISFLDNVKYKDDFLNTHAGACFVTPEVAALAPKHTVCLISNTPYKAYALTAQLFYPTKLIDGAVEDSARIHNTVNVPNSVYIGHNVVIGRAVSIGENCYIGHNTVIEDGVSIGSDCVIDGNATISHALIGDYVRIYPGVRIGQDGFGFAIDPAGHVKVPQLGRVIIQDHVEIGANTTIDRGAGPDTVIGQGTWIDNLVQIGHNVCIGKGCVIVSQVGIAGSAKISDYVAIGGQAGIAGHLNIGVGARIGAQSGIMSDIPAGQEYLGSPAFPKSQFLRQVAALNRLIKNKKKD